MQKVILPYEHNPQDLTPIWLAVSVGTPRDGDWKPALRDTIDGRRVVWVKLPDPLPQGHLWVKDRAGARRQDIRIASSEPPARRRRRPG